MNNKNEIKLNKMKWIRMIMIMLFMLPRTDHQFISGFSELVYKELNELPLKITNLWNYTPKMSWIPHYQFPWNITQALHKEDDGCN